MLLSMTGHGQSQRVTDEMTIWAEVRSVNNRFLKVTISSGDRVAELEANIRQMVQEHVRRGTVHVNLEIHREASLDSVRINTELLKQLHRELTTVDPQASAACLVALPGIVENAAPRRPDCQKLWQQIAPALQSALEQLHEMRRQEGQSMTSDLRENCRQIREQLAVVQSQAPEVARNYAQRLRERINQLLVEYPVTVSETDLIREVGIFADRCDISEEVVRLQAHIEQFDASVNSGQSDGRKLEFLTQEMLRETNTIGSKANDREISRSVVEIKTAIERIREMIQNIE